MNKNEINVAQLSDDERQECEVWTRVMGYHRPLSYFNIGKRGEHAERVHFLESMIRGSCCSDHQ
ncbi:MAG: anaerobic ribonucleoside-triphosphate reductase [Holosporaceae bacterium]|jgi:anaerobic ribonucleoside-triphosphate reductase|nr:anaerobic ribonucleoside-triphosphate reductase [Holosporaceae bacterium]